VTEPLFEPLAPHEKSCFSCGRIIVFYTLGMEPKNAPDGKVRCQDCSYPSRIWHAKYDAAEEILLEERMAFHTLQRAYDVLKHVSTEEANGLRDELKAERMRHAGELRAIERAK
jgi:hypothetical protein